MKSSIFKWPDCLQYDINRQLVHLNHHTIYRVASTFPSRTFGSSVIIPDISSLKNRTGFKQLLCECANIYTQKLFD